MAKSPTGFVFASFLICVLTSFTSTLASGTPGSFSLLSPHYDRLLFAISYCHYMAQMLSFCDNTVTRGKLDKLIHKIQPARMRQVAQGIFENATGSLSIIDR